MEIEVLAGLLGTAGSVILAIGISHGRTQESIKGVIRRLDTLNGSQLAQDVKLQEHGERLSHLEGEHHEHSGDGST